MISRSNYIAITLIMCIVLLMFQLTGISENVLMNEGENIYVREAVPEEQIAPEQQRYEQQQEQVELVEGTEETVGLVGNLSEDCLQIGRNWSLSQKRQYCIYENLEEAAADVSGAGFFDCERRNTDGSGCSISAGTGTAGKKCGGFRAAGHGSVGVQPAIVPESRSFGDCGGKDNR